VLVATFASHLSDGMINQLHFRGDVTQHHLKRGVVETAAEFVKYKVSI
jgi:hypothetical protein